MSDLAESAYMKRFFGC